MDTQNPFICPQCGFPIFNRRYPRCERCGDTLPAHLLYSADELAALRSKEAREDEARQREYEVQRLRNAEQHDRDHRFNGAFGDSAGETSIGSFGGVCVDGSFTNACSSDTASD
jgi:superfamily II DNA or RNA helicase